MKNIIPIAVLLVLIITGYYLFSINKPEPTPVISQPVPTSTTAPERLVTIESTEFSYDVKEITVKKGEKVKLTLNNKIGFHDLVIDELSVNTGKLNADQSVTIEFTPETVGEFEYYCSVGDHRAKGMVGKIIVLPQ